MEIVNTIGYPVYRGDLTDLNISEKKSFLINTISPNSYGLAQEDKLTERALKESDILILDGVYFGWASLFLNRKKINRITGWDAFIALADWAEKNNGKVFFLGSSEETLQKIRDRFTKDYPNVSIGSFSPPFKEQFSESDNLSMRDAINKFRPDILFVGMTAPKQEKWGYFNKDFIDVKVICTIGNVFDWYAGNTKRPSVIWQKLGLEWLVRIFLRPEIFKRNIGNQLLFFWHLFLYITKIK